MSYTKDQLEYPYDLHIETFDSTINSNMRLENILKYQQQAGEDQLEVFNLGYNELCRRGYAFVVTNAKVIINRMPKYLDEITLVTWNRGIKGAKYFRSYNWYDKNGELLVESSTIFVIVDVKEHKLRKPDCITVGIPYDFDRQNAAENPKKVFLPDEDIFKKVGEKRIVFSELDGNGHLNNAFYSNFLTDFTPNIEHKQITEFSIDFISEARLNDIVNVYSATKDGVTYFYGEHERGRCFRASCIYIDI